MHPKKKVTDYVSGIDRFLHEFEQQPHALSKSQQQEIAKHQRISRLRDNANPPAASTKLWDEF